MKLSIPEAVALSCEFLKNLGFSYEISDVITDHLIDAELCGRATHGLMRLNALKRAVTNGEIDPKISEIKIVKETAVSLFIDGQKLPGLFVVEKALRLAIEKIKQSGMVAVGCTNTSAVSGMIGHFAKIAAEKDLIFIGFNNSSGGLIPHGSIKELWGTNPITVGVPTNDLPVILDMASSKITYGQIVLTKAAGKQLPSDVTLDKKGQPTTDPAAVFDGGGLLPFDGYRGSGIAFIVELLGGALTKSRVGTKVPGGWGSFFVLIDPTMFREIDEFKKDVESAIAELKSLPKAKGVTEIFYPGERSQKLSAANSQAGFFEIDDKLYSDLQS